MPIKGMFNQKVQKQALDDLEKQTLRINALEVQLKSLLEFEKKIRTSMYSYNSGEKKELERVKTQGKDFQINMMENAQEIKEINQKLEEMGQRVDQLENINPFPRKSEYKVDERLIHFIEQLISEKYAVHIQKEKKLVEKIQALENEISILKHRKLPNEDRSIIEDHRQTSSEDFSTHEHKNEKRDDKEVFYTQIEMRVQLLERNILLVNEVQAGLLKRMEETIEKSNGLVKQMNETEVSMKNEEPILKTLYIDKLYLERYEQNNNFAQIGIKSLSGALNIGATYGKEAIPKKITDQVKEEMEKMKEMKVEMENSQPSTNQSSAIHDDESSSEVASAPSDEKIQYTEIIIEEDNPSLDEDIYNDEK
ncbi:hypothetical protein [Neobacillus vireti]|uniref:hypothetical protein n=1 Tax=Neobacillus vireti TaxID=220686 RepID=UPI0030009FF4